MIFYIIKRVFQAAAVMILVAFISFVLFNYVGDPVNNMVGQEATIEDREALRERLGLNDPVIVQFSRFVIHALEGNFGISYRMQRPVKDLIAERLPATLELVFTSAVLALIIGIPLGIYTGLHRDSWPSRLILSSSLAGVSLPTFVIGILLIYVFSVSLNVLPSYGRGGVVKIFGSWTSGLLTTSGLKAIILPSITLCLYQLTLILRIVRAEMLEVLLTDDGQGHKLRACAQKHPRTRHHGHRPAGRFPDRLFHHYRDGFPVARHGVFVHPGGAFCGCSDYGRLYGPYGPFFRDHQSYSRFAVFRC
jgi:peptide/nickel transport system permease protein